MKTIGAIWGAKLTKKTEPTDLFARKRFHKRMETDGNGEGGKKRAIRNNRKDRVNTRQQGKRDL